jgi:hypothetical protein
MQELEVQFTGRVPLVVHNVRLANPLDPHARALKALSGKRNKTEDDYAEMVRVEWEGGLYWDDDLGPYLPARYPVAALRASGAMTKHKTALVRGLTVSAPDGGERLPIEYDGPRTIADLWDEAETYCDVRAVKVGQARVFRARPRFPEWAVTFRAMLDTEQVDLDVFEAIVARAGRLIGMGEAAEGARARFTAEVKVLAEVAA